MAFVTGAENAKKKINFFKNRKKRLFFKNKALYLFSLQAEFSAGI